MPRGIFVRDVCLFNKSQVQKHNGSNKYYAPIFTTEGSFWYIITITVEMYSAVIAPMSNGFKHVVFSGYLRDVPLMQDHLGLVNESRQQIEITSFECLKSQVEVPAILMEVASGTVAPLEFAHGPPEGYYLLKMKEPAVFTVDKDVPVDEQPVGDDVDDGDINPVEDIDKQLGSIEFSDFDKEILGVVSTTAAEESKNVMGKAIAKSVGSKKSMGKRIVRTSAKPSRKGKEQMNVVEDIVLEMAGEKEEPQPEPEPQTHSMFLLSNLAKKGNATTSMAAVAVGKGHESNESSYSVASSSSSDADYDGLLDLGDQGLKRVRTTDTGSSKKAKKKKTKTDLLKFMQDVVQKKK